MESLILSLEAIAPIFLLLVLGYVLKCLKMADKRSFDAMNSLGFKVFLPTLLFYNVYKTEDTGIIDIKLIIFTIVGVMAVFAVGLVTAVLFTKDNSKRGVILQGFFRSNFAILGLPLVNYVCGEGSGGLAALMVAVVIPVFNVFAVISLEIFRGNTIDFSKIFKQIAKNPLIIGCVIGLIFLFGGITLPSFLEKPISDVSKIASPLAIIVLGAGFNFSDMRGYAKYNVLVVSARLVIVPLVMLTIAALLGFTGEALCCLIVVFGSPVAVSSFSMAQQMGGDEKLAAQIVVLSSALCVFTLFAWIFIFSSLGVI